MDSKTKRLDTNKLSTYENIKLGSLGLQGTQGDASGSKPRSIFPLRKSIFEAWEFLKGMDKNEAQKKYLDLAFDFL